MFFNIISAIKERTNRARETAESGKEHGGQVDAGVQTDMHEDMQLYESDAGLDMEDDSACDLSPLLKPASHASIERLEEHRGSGRTWQMVQCGLSF